MPPVIHLSEETRQRLTHHREAIEATTVEEAILHLLSRSKRDSAFGSIPEWDAWSRDDRFTSRSNTVER